MYTHIKTSYSYIRMYAKYNYTYKSTIVIRVQFFISVINYIYI